MKADVVNAFLDPAVAVWRRELQAELTFREAEAAPAFFTTTGVTAVLTVRGELAGHVFYELADEDARAIAGAESARDDHAHEAAGRLASAIADGAAQALAGAGYSCTVEPPFLLAAGAAVTATAPQLLAHFDSPLGRLSVRVGLAERP